MNPIIGFLLKQVVDIVLGADVFDRVLGAVERWADKEISSLEKQQGAKAEIEMLGIEVAGQWANWAIETAVALLKDKVK